MNNKYADTLKLARIQIVITIVFIFFKLIRPSALESTSFEFFKIVLFSLPNFFEAIIGILTLTGIGLIVGYLIIQYIKPQFPSKTMNVQ